MARNSRLSVCFEIESRNSSHTHWIRSTIRSRPLRMELEHPVPHRLQPNAADRGGSAPRAPVIDRRQDRQSSGLIGIV